MSDDGQQQREQDERQAYYWHLLSELKPALSAETFQQAEREIGLTPQKGSNERR